MCLGWHNDYKQYCLLSIFLKYVCFSLTIFVDNPYVQKWHVVLVIFHCKRYIWMERIENKMLFIQFLKVFFQYYEKVV